MNEDIQEASETQSGVRESEREQRAGRLDTYDDQHVRQAIVHAREC